MNLSYDLNCDIGVLKSRLSIVDSASNKTESNKNFGISENDFEQLASELRQGNEHFFELAFLNNFADSVNFVIHKHKASRDNAYDAVMTTLMEFRQRIIDKKVKYGNLKFMFNQMCAQRYKRSMGSKLDLDEFAYLSRQDIIPIDDETYEILDKSLEKLGENCQQIIKDIYFNNFDYKTLEVKYKLAAATLRKQKQRCVSKLKMMLLQQLNR